jgi:DNA-binding GntR family transcriptional regulator
MGTNKYGELTRRKGGRTFVTHAPFPRPLARNLEKIREEMAEASKKPAPAMKAAQPQRTFSPKLDAQRRNKRSVAHHFMKGLGLTKNP